MGRPLLSEGRQTRQAFLDTALALFADKGYFGTSLREIASAVGVRESALYNYFPSKEALLIALLETNQQSVQEQLARLLAEPITDVKSFLEQLTARILDRFSEPQQQQLFRVLMSDGIRLTKGGRLNLSDRLTAGARPLHALMVRLIRDRSLRSENAEQLAVEFMGPLFLWRHLHALSPNDPLVVDRESFVRRHVDQFLSGAGRISPARPRAELTLAVPRAPGEASGRRRQR